MTLKVLSYNVHKGFALGPQKFTLHLIRDAIRQTGADICFLQEVVGENQIFQKSIGNWPTESQFEFLADSVWTHHSYGKNAVFPERHHGNAILSKFPIVSEHNLNISTNRFEQRGLLHCKIRIPGKSMELDLFNTHLNLMHASRLKQVRMITEQMSKLLEPEHPLILAGDFNDWSHQLSDKLGQAQSLKECFTEAYGKPARTFPSVLPLAPLDRIYFRHLKVTSQMVFDQNPWPGLSDHLPLYAEFKI